MNSLKTSSCAECKVKSICFKQLNEEELLLTNENKVQIQFKKGEIISKQGSFNTRRYAIPY